MRTAGYLAVLFVALLSIGSVQAEDEPKIVRVKAAVGSESVEAMGTFDVDLQVRIRSPWHINSQDPGIDLLIPTSVRMEDPDVVELVGAVYPKAVKRRFPYHKKPLPVFEGRIPITLKLKLKPAAEAGPNTLQGILRFQACSRNSCLPPEEVPFTVKVVVTE